MIMIFALLFPLLVCSLLTLKKSFFLFTSIKDILTYNIRIKHSSQFKQSSKAVISYSQNQAGERNLIKFQLYLSEPLE